MKKWVFIVLAIVASVLIARGLQRAPAPSDALVIEPTEEEAASNPLPSPSVSSVVEMARRAKTPASPKPLAADFAIVDEVPSLEEYRKEVEANPHGMPPSLAALSKKMARAVERSLADVESARAFAPELAKCVEKVEIPSAQQSCLVNARRLRARHPSLRQEFDAVEAAAPQELKDRVQAWGL